VFAGLPAPVQIRDQVNLPLADELVYALCAREEVTNVPPIATTSSS
jgi:hypothetical protein